jgi:hypothetical protein
MTPPLCILVKGFPRLSETFITRELEALQDAGVAFMLASLRQPQPEVSIVAHRVAASVNYLPEYLHEEPLRVMRTIGDARRRTGFARAWAMFRADLRRDFSRNRFRRFGQACVLAAELPASTRHLHAHFIHTPASVARYAAAIREITFSVSAHAKDIWTTPEWDLRAKLNEAAFSCTCNLAGATRLNALSLHKPLHVWAHLVSLAAPASNRTAVSRPLRLLTVARAVPKKGLKLLLQALALLPPEPAWTWTHIGGGPELDALKAQAARHPYKERLKFLGARPNPEVIEALEEHQIFILTAQIAEDGDQDGRPNALIEAMSAGLACLATPVGGIPELIDRDHGILVQPEPAAIADAIRDLLSRPETVIAMGRAAQTRARTIRDQGAAGFAALERALREASGQ